jgi:Leucine-rich repeat (LRR) protein
MQINLNYKDLEGVLDIEQYCKDNNIDTEKVTSLDCSDNQLTELKGLNKLVNLKNLDCEYNKLTELDLSKLVNLEWLNGDKYKQPEPEPLILDNKG